MKNQLSDISTQYRKFSKGQYIEYTQFNEFLDFFEDQDRLSRVMLQGVGIVCGFKPNLIYANRILSSLRLSQGVAVTTDGDLLTLNNTNKVSEDLYVSDLKTIDIESKDYTHFKVYDNFKVEYPAFYQGGKQIELWELATAQEADSGFQPINNLANLDDKYLLLYLENYEKEVKPCRGVDCDNHGIQQIRNLKVLVTTAKGIANILGKDRIQPHPLFIDDIMGYGKQERVIVERLIEGQGIDKEFLSSDIKSLYATVLKNNDYGRIIFEKINAIAQLIGLPTAYYQGFKNTLESFLTQSAGFQYAYDVVKDLADTYCEIIKLLPKAFTVNLPDVDSFPKHIMLGKLIPSTQLDFSRHQFYNSAVLDDEKSTQKVKLLINRFVQQAQNFRNFPVADNGNAQIKIIPSQKLNPLSHKAVPFYYTVNDEFLKSWNFDKTSNRSFRDNLGYNNWLSSDEYVVKPLDFNIDKNSFYNIEGHQGMHYQKAFDLLNQIRNKQQLGFDVMVLSLAELVDNKDMFKAYFNEYVEKHPGLEHKRGVERGGTFIIVHESLENPTVFADFSLPYICCTPKVKIGLSLPNTVICSEATRIPFTVIPVNGVVKATIGSDPTGVELVNGKYFFNPKLVSPQLYGQAIGFTVNGKPTNCSIKVIAEPKVKVAVTSVSYADGDPTTATVEFTVSGQNFTDYTYSWDFWDNGGWVTMNPNSRGFVSYTFHNLNPKIIPTIRVRVGNSGCTQEIAIGNWYHVPAAPTVVVDNINFSDGINCCEGSVPVIKAEATGPDTVFIRDGSFMVQGQGDGPSTLLYSWAKINGPTATLSGVNSPELEVKDLAAGEYIFQLTVVDVGSGLFAKSQEVVVNVIYEG